jgi:hypothetical protein
MTVNDDKHFYDHLREHIGHEVVCVCYGPGQDPDNISIECEDCHVVLVDVTLPEKP